MLTPQELKYWIPRRTLSSFLSLERGFVKYFVGCRARAVTLHHCVRDRENTLAQLCKFKHGFGETKLRQWISMWHDEQYGIFSKPACFVPLQKQGFWLFCLLFLCLADENFVCFTRHEPMGVCGAITPVSDSDGALHLPQNWQKSLCTPHLLLQPFAS